MCFVWLFEARADRTIGLPNYWGVGDANSTGATSFHSTARTKGSPDFAIASLEDKSFDLALNQDSLPEMNESTMCGYLDEIARLVDGRFLSINHESGQAVGGGFRHGIVRAATDQRPAFHPVYRMPYWMRPGYVEELFELRG